MNLFGWPKNFWRHLSLKNSMKVSKWTHKIWECKQKTKIWFILIYVFISLLKLRRDNRSFNVSGANINLRNDFNVFRRKIIYNVGVLFLTVFFLSMKPKCFYYYFIQVTQAMCWSMAILKQHFLNWKQYFNIISRESQLFRWACIITPFSTNLIIRSISSFRLAIIWSLIIHG